MQEEQFTDEFLFLCRNRLKRFAKNTKHFFSLQIFFQTAAAVFIQQFKRDVIFHTSFKGEILRGI